MEPFSTIIALEDRRVILSGLVGVGGDERDFGLFSKLLSLFFLFSGHNSSVECNGLLRYITVVAAFGEQVVGLVEGGEEDFIVGSEATEEAIDEHRFTNRQTTVQ